MTPYARYLSIIIPLAMGQTTYGQTDSMPAANPPAHHVQAVLDTPLRDPALCRGPDGMYYLTGTDGTPSIPEYGPVNFENNDGIRIWKSKDLKTWEALGKVFDIVMAKDEKSIGGDWWRIPTPGAEPMSRPVRGVYAPKIYPINNSYWIILSINGAKAGILVSQTGKIEGPYAIASNLNTTKKSSTALVSDPQSASLFQDDDGKVYLVWGDAWIAPMHENGSAVAGQPFQLLYDTSDDTPLLGQRGYALAKINGTYWLTAEVISCVDGKPRADVYAACSDRLSGPYTNKRLLLANARATTLCQGPDGHVYATHWSNVGAASTQDRVGITMIDDAALTTTAK